MSIHVPRTEMQNLSLNAGPTPPPGLGAPHPPPGFGAPEQQMAQQGQMPQGQQGPQQVQARGGNAPANSGGPQGGRGGNGQGGQSERKSPNLGMPPQPQQLPPQMFTTAAQLLDLTDKKLLVALRDGRKLHGILRSWDQFANLVLQSTSERLFTTSAPLLYCDVPRGTFLVRGENVLLLGEIDLDRDDDAPVGYEKGDVALVEQRVKAERKEGEKKDGRKVRRLRGEGFVGEEGEAVL